MKTTSYEARTQRLGIVSTVGLSPRQIKESMLEVLLKRHRPAQAAQIISSLPQTLEASLDMMLETLESEDRIDYPENSRQPELKPIMFSRVVRLVDSAALTEAEASRRVYLPVSGEGFRKIKKLVADLQAMREKRQADMLQALLDRFKDDRQAMFLWGRFCAADVRWRRGYASRDLRMIFNANAEIDRIFASHHAFAAGLVLLYASAEDVWWHLGPFFERMKDQGYREKLLRSNGRRAMNERTAINATLDLLRLFGLFPPNRKTKRLKRI